MNKYIIFSVLVICQYIMDRTSIICATNTGEILLFFHHIFAVYLYFGALFFDPLIHLIVIVCTLFHWYTYKKCILTEILRLKRRVPILCQYLVNFAFFGQVQVQVQVLYR